MTTRLRHMQANIDLFACPRCRGNLELRERERVKCSGCKAEYEISGGIPLLFEPAEIGQGDVTQSIKNFYEENPFPNYEGMESISDLIDKAERGLFARMLNEQIPFGARIFEVGCGTGQLSNFLGISSRQVFGVDMCLNSLKLAQEFKTDNDIQNAGFYQMNLFRPAIKEKSFHIVICNGVLHHTSNPRLGFETIAKLVKPGGFILVGLYNRFGRMLNDARGVIFRLSGGRFKFLDPRLLDRHATKSLVWFRDQYQNPHESKHTIGEVLGWFQSFGFEFCYGIPNPRLRERFDAADFMFSPRPPGNVAGRFLAQFLSVFSGWQEGGLFIMIGKRK